jgi:hypothetical protein
LGHRSIFNKPISSGSTTSASATVGLTAENPSKTGRQHSEPGRLRDTSQARKRPMEPISKTIETVLGRQPAPNSEASESPSLTAPPSANYFAESGNLATRWQRLRIGLETITPAVQVMATEAEHWCSRVRNNASRVARLIVLAGPFGCGKTEILKGARGYIKDIYMRVDDCAWKKSITIASIVWPEFIADYISQKNNERMEDIITSDVVFIDDVGAESDRFRSGEPTQILGEMLGALDKKFVFITTNIEPAGWKLRWDGRVEDRLLRNGAVVVDGYDPELRAMSYQKWRLTQ